MVLNAYATSTGSGEIAHLRSLTRASRRSCARKRKELKVKIKALVYGCMCMFKEMICASAISTIITSDGGKVCYDVSLSRFIGRGIINR